MTHSRLLAALGAAAAGAGAGWLLLRDQTTDSDETGEDVGRVDVGSGAGTLGARAVEILSRHVGEHGQGKKGTPDYHRSPLIDRINRGLYGDAPGLLGGPWCARAARYAYEVAAQELGQPRPFVRISSDLASVSKWKKYLGAHKTALPKVGAVLLIGDEHATMIARPLDARTVVTVEGNHGDKVAHVRRTIGPKDTIIDVEGYVAAARGGAAVGCDLDLLEAA